MERDVLGMILSMAAQKRNLAKLSAEPWAPDCDYGWMWILDVSVVVQWFFLISNRRSKRASTRFWRCALSAWNSRHYHATITCTLPCRCKRTHLRMVELGLSGSLQSVKSAMGRMRVSSVTIRISLVSLATNNALRWTGWTKAVNHILRDLYLFTGDRPEGSLSRADHRFLLSPGDGFRTLFDGGEKHPTTRSANCLNFPRGRLWQRRCLVTTGGSLGTQ
jgi:hypothetical protein